MLLFYQASGDVEGLLELSALASDKGEANVSFLCFLLLGRTTQCIQVTLTLT
jgi:coatomer subunit beta'